MRGSACGQTVMGTLGAGSFADATALLSLGGARIPSFPTSLREMVAEVFHPSTTNPHCLSELQL